MVGGEERGSEGRVTGLSSIGNRNCVGGLIRSDGSIRDTGHISILKRKRTSVIL